MLIVMASLNVCFFKEVRKHQSLRISTLFLKYIFNYLLWFVSEPDPSTLKVQNLTYIERNTSTLEQFDYLVSWQKPLFNESSVTKYAISYKRTGNPDRQKLWQFKTVRV